MESSIFKKARKFLREQHRRKRWQRAAAFLGCTVTFVTAYMLILPAVTMSTYCGEEEHTHTEECYEKALVCGYPAVSEEGTGASAEAETRSVLDCHVDVHQHDVECYDDTTGELICGYADHVVHTHNEGCWDEEGNLVCTLPEVKEHQHDESCYIEERVLICGQAEGEEHVHDESCYEVIRNYTCGKDEVILHEHSDQCYEWENGQRVARICGMLQVLEHTHDAGCFRTETVEQPVEEKHVHTDDCYEPRVICEKEEHVHSEECYVNPEDVEDGTFSTESKEQGDGSEDSKEADAEGPENPDGSEDAEDDGSRDGESPSKKEHQEVTEPTCGLEEHEHTDECMEDGNLVCGMEKHTHSVEAGCYLSEADRAAVNEVISLIDALKEAIRQMGQEEQASEEEQGQQVFRLFSEEPEAGEDEEEPGVSEEELEQIQQQASETYKKYQALGEELQPYVTNADVLLDNLSWLPAMYADTEDSGQEGIPKYSSNLGDFKTEIVMKDSEGNEIQPNGTIIVGNRYNINLTFSETKELQFAYDDNGWLTYQLQSFTCKGQSGNIRDENTDVIGEYVIDEHGLLKVKFGKTTIKDKDGKDIEVNQIDKGTDAYVSINIDVTADAGENGDKIVIPWGGDASIEYKVDHSANVDVSKIAGKYDPTEHTVEYTVEITDTKGLIKGGKLEDVMQNGMEYVENSLKVTWENGDSVTPTPQVQKNGGGFSLDGLPDLVQGDKLIVTYKAKVPDNAYNGTKVDFTADNTAHFTGNGGSVVDEGSATKKIDSDIVQKTGRVTEIEVEENGNRVKKSVIQWTVIVGDGSKPLEGVTIRDTLGPNQKIYVNGGLQVKVWNKNNPDKSSDISGYFEENQEFRLTPEGSQEYTGVNITLPSGNKEKGNVKLSAKLEAELGAGNDTYHQAELIYYSEYTIPADADGTQQTTFTNTINTTIDGKDYGTTGEIGVIGNRPDVTKEKISYDEDTIEYSVSIKVPGSYYGQKLYLSDGLAFWNVGGITGNSIYVENNPQNMEVKVNGTEYSPYNVGDDVAGTYYRLPSGQNGFMLFFHTNGQYWPEWPFTNDVTVTITYSIPKTAKVYESVNGAVVEIAGKTLQDYLDAGECLCNQVGLLRYEEGSKDTELGTDVAFHAEGKSITKSHTINKDGSITYKVRLKNFKDSQMATVLTQGTKNIVFKDDFDNTYLKYREGTLVMEFYNTGGENSGYYFQYQGSPLDEKGDIYAKAEKFEDENKKTTLAAAMEMFDNQVLAGTFEFSYTLDVNQDALGESENAFVDLKNEATISYNDNGKIGPAEDTVSYKTGLIDKRAEQIMDGGQGTELLKFTIELNPNKKDLVPDVGRYTVEDVMKESLELVHDSVTVIKIGAEGEETDLTRVSDPAQVEENEEYFAKSFDTENNKLTITVPDEQHLKIVYTTRMKGNLNQELDVGNTASINGDITRQDRVDANYRIEKSSAQGGVNTSYKIFKQNSETGQVINGVQFKLYSCKVPGVSDAGSSDGNDPDTITVKGKDGTRYQFKFETSVVTKGSGTADMGMLEENVLYALVEPDPPEGYMPHNEPYVFALGATYEEYKEKIDGLLEAKNGGVTIKNVPYGVELPETGGNGTILYTIAGFALITTAGFMYKKRLDTLRKGGRRRSGK